MHNFMSDLFTLLLLVVAVCCSPYKLGSGGLVDPNGRSRAGRFFDTYVTHLPPPMMEPEPVIPMMNYYPGAGMIPPGYAMFHPFDLGLPLNFSPDGGAIYCPREYVYDGYMDPFEYGICFVHSHGYYK